MFCVQTMRAFTAAEMTKVLEKVNWLRQAASPVSPAAAPLALEPP
jgi:hypothetical protein